MLTVVCFKWRSNPGYRAKFEALHVNRLAAMFRRCLRTRHEFICVTDDARGIDDNIRIVPLWPDLAHVPNPHGPREPSCYRRLKLFDPAMDLGERILWCDLDMVLTGDVTPLFDRPESMVLLATDTPNIPVNGSLVLFSPAKHHDLWAEFDPATSPALARRAGCWGSDQGWLAYRLKDRAAFWKPGPGGDGIYFFGQHMRRNDKPGQLPQDARLVSFHGRGAPWEETHLPWVARHWADTNQLSKET